MVAFLSTLYSTPAHKNNRQNAHKLISGVKVRLIFLFVAALIIKINNRQNNKNHLIGVYKPINMEFVFGITIQRGKSKIYEIGIVWLINIFFISSPLY